MPVIKVVHELQTQLILYQKGYNSLKLNVSELIVKMSIYQACNYRLFTSCPANQKALHKDSMLRQRLGEKQLRSTSEGYFFKCFFVVSAK